MDALIDISKLISVWLAELGPDASEWSGQASSAMKAIRESAEKRDPFELWDAIDAEIGKSSFPGLLSQLIKFRSAYQEHLAASILGEVTNSLTKSKSAAWQTWAAFVARSVSLFRFWLTERLCAAPIQFEEEAEELARKIRKVAPLLAQDRWPEVRSAIEGLAGLEFLEPRVRGELLTTIAEIDNYYYQKTERALKELQGASKLAGDTPRILSCFGDYWAGQSELDQAEEYFRKAVEASRNHAMGYVGIADCREKKGETAVAEGWCQKAIEMAPGDSDGYSQWINLAGNPKRFGDAEGRLQDLVAKITAVHPPGGYTACLDAGEACKRNDKRQQAHEWYGRAAKIDPTRPDAFVQAGNYELELENWAEAKEYFEKAVAAAPEAYDGYHALGELYERQKQWAESLEAFRQARKKSPERASFIGARIGLILESQEKLREAEEFLAGVLSADKEIPVARDALEVLADTYYREKGDAEAAERIYSTILRILGGRYEADYHNRVGNLHYYFGRYNEAITEYEKAVAAQPDSPTFHRNLADACREMKWYDEAESELQTAFALDKDEKTHKKQLSLLFSEMGNDAYSNENYEQAIEWYGKATELSPEDAGLHFNLSLGWEKLQRAGKRTEEITNAINELKEADRLAPRDGYDEGVRRLERKRAVGEQFGEKALDRVNEVMPLAVEIAPDLFPLVEGAGGTLTAKLSQNLEQLRASIQERYGVRLPAVRFIGNAGDFSAGTYLIFLLNIPIATGEIALDKRFCGASTDRLAKLGISGKEAINPATAEPGVWVQEKDWKRAESAGLPLWDVMEYPVRHLEAIALENLPEFAGHDDLMNIAEKEIPDDAKVLKEKLEELTKLTAVCRGLLMERTPIRPFAEMYKSFAQLDGQGMSPGQIAEEVRALPDFRPRLLGNDSTYTHVTLSDRFESVIRGLVYRGGMHPVLAMLPEECQAALNATRAALKDIKRPALVVRNQEIRALVRQLLVLEFPGLPVLSRSELKEELLKGEMPKIDWEYSRDQFRPSVTTRQLIAALPEPSTPEESGNRVKIGVFTSAGAFAQFVDAGVQPIAGRFSEMQDGLFDELGSLVPDIRLQPDNSLAEDEFRFQINEEMLPRRTGLRAGEFLINEKVERLRRYRIEARAKENPTTGMEAAIVGDASAKDLCVSVGLTAWDCAGYLVLELSEAIRKHAARLQNKIATQFVLDNFREKFPYLTTAALERFGFDRIQEILRSLLREEISIRDLRSVLEGLLSIGSVTDADLTQFIVFRHGAENLCPVSGQRGFNELTTEEYVEGVRATLKRYITYKYAKGGRTLPVYLVDQGIEHRLARIPEQPLNEQESTQLIEAVRKQSPTAGLPRDSVLLTTSDVRKTLYTLLAGEIPRVSVLSYQELSPYLSIQTLQRISLN